MMGRLNRDQGEFFYSFRLDEAVPDDHPVRAIAAILDLSWGHSELAPFYPKIGRPSIDPVLTALCVRMQALGLSKLYISRLWPQKRFSGSVKTYGAAWSGREAYKQRHITSEQQ